MTIPTVTSSEIPIRLKDGEEAKYFISLDDEHDWIGQFIKDYLPNFIFLRLNFLSFRVHTTIGSMFTTGIEDSLIKIFTERFKKDKEINQ